MLNVPDNYKFCVVSLVTNLPVSFYDTSSSISYVIIDSDSFSSTPVVTNNDCFTSMYIIHCVYCVHK